MLKTSTEIDPNSTGVRSPALLFGSPQTVIGLRLVCLQARLNRNRQAYPSVSSASRRRSLNSNLPVPLSLELPRRPC